MAAVSRWYKPGDEPLARIDALERDLKAANQMIDVILARLSSLDSASGQSGAGPTPGHPDPQPDDDARGG